MFYKISNIASKKSIENNFQATFEFPKLYEPQEIIDGLKESTVSVITCADTHKITFAIWGLLPENFEDHWSVFQDVVNTLNVKIDVLQTGRGLYNNLLENRRCIIIATGFFTTLLTNGTVEHCHVHLSNFEPFAIAGVYNKLNDGFITCSMVMTQVNESFESIPNISYLKPFVLHGIELEKWLDVSTSIDELNKMVLDHQSIKFQYESYNSIHSSFDSI